MAPPKSRMLDIALGMGAKKSHMGPPPGDDDEPGYDGDDEKPSDAQVRCGHDLISAIQAGDAEGVAEAILAITNGKDDDGPEDDEGQDEGEEPSEDDSDEG